MLALICGLGAALAWAVHDVLVRRLSQGIAILPMMLVVVCAGLVGLIGPTLIWGGWDRMTGAAWAGSVAAGLAYVLGLLGLYQAFKIAPPRLVAPVLGAYPLLTLLAAMAQGRAVSGGEWLAVLAIVTGIAIVALTSADTQDDPAPPLGPALAWSAFGAVGFAATFAFGQQAARDGAEMPTILIARVAALLVVAAMVMAMRAPLAPARRAWPVLAGMGLLDATALAVVQIAGRLEHPEYAAIAASLFGVITILLAWRFLAEAVRPLQWLGIAVVFGGIATLSALG